MELELFRLIFNNKYISNYIYKCIEEHNNNLYYTRLIRKKPKRYNELRNVESLLKKNQLNLFLDKCKRIIAHGLDIHQELYFRPDAVKLICLLVNDMTIFTFLYQQLYFLFEGQILVKVKPLPIKEPFQGICSGKSPYTVDSSNIFSKCCESGSLEKCKFIWNELNQSKLESPETIDVVYCFQRSLESGSRDVVDWFIATFQTKLNSIKDLPWRLILPHLVKYKWMDIFSKFGTPAAKIYFSELNEFKISVSVDTINIPLLKTIISKPENCTTKTIRELTSSVCAIKVCELEDIVRNGIVEQQIELINLLLPLIKKYKLEIDTFEFLQKLVHLNNFSLFKHIDENFPPIGSLSYGTLLEYICEHSQMDFLRYITEVKKIYMQNGNSSLLSLVYPMEVIKYLHDQYKNIYFLHFSISRMSKEKIEFVGTHTRLVDDFLLKNATAISSKLQLGLYVESGSIETLLNNSTPISSKSQYRWYVEPASIETLKICMQKCKSYDIPFMPRVSYNLLAQERKITSSDLQWILDQESLKPEFINSLSYFINYGRVECVEYLLARHFEECPELTLEQVKNAMKSNSLEMVKLILRYYPHCSVADRIVIDKTTFEHGVPVNINIYKHIASNSKITFLFRQPIIKKQIKKENLPLIQFISETNLQQSIFNQDLMQCAMSSLSIFKWLYENRSEGGDYKSLMALAQLSKELTKPLIIKYLNSMKLYIRKTVVK
ncbi:hypothetical protein DLAC_01242 [Tieghemostelium lacteum]|uniref:Uncharacterized protein n=1 Tax=Tieghemostelium lacteum TaxID=361077 RepID=A0A152A837_TIELA|nr:hypothetical protein DLAC_01242 [Tieghemostelium lacteum]|eukprot:KYR02402.1 hypothetical protein DLAC_01242 [Tieghemostelium lacteum]